MNNTFKTVALGVALALPAFSMAPASFAQPGAKMGPKMGGPGGKMGGPGMMKRMEQSLGITPAQKAKLDVVMKANREKMRSIRESTSLKPDQKRAQMKAQRTASMARMNAILTPAQRSKVAAMQAQMMAQMKQRGMGAPAGR